MCYCVHTEDFLMGSFNDLEPSHLAVPTCCLVITGVSLHFIPAYFDHAWWSGGVEVDNFDQMCHYAELNL